ELGPSRVPVSFVSWLLALTIALAPIVGLAYRALLPAPGVPFTLDNISLNNFANAVSNPRVIDGFQNSAFLAITAAIGCGILGWLVGILVTRTNLLGNTALSLVVLLTTDLPGFIFYVLFIY